MISHQLFGVWRPRDRGEHVIVALRPVIAQGRRGSRAIDARGAGLFAFRGLLLATSGPQKDVVVLDDGFPLAVERGAHRGLVRACGAGRTTSAAAATTASAPTLALPGCLDYRTTARLLPTTRASIAA